MEMQGVIDMSFKDIALGALLYKMLVEDDRKKMPVEDDRKKMVDVKRNTKLQGGAESGEQVIFLVLAGIAIVVPIVFKCSGLHQSLLICAFTVPTVSLLFWLAAPRDFTLTRLGNFLFWTFAFGIGIGMMALSSLALAFMHGVFITICAVIVDFLAVFWITVMAMVMVTENQTNAKKQ